MFYQIVHNFGVLALSDFASCFKSGMQIQDVDLGGETLYGLATLESLVSPWKLHALHPEEPEDGDFIVTDVIPIEADSDYVKWLEDLRESKVSGLAKMPSFICGLLWNRCNRAKCCSISHVGPAYCWRNKSSYTESVSS